MKESLETCTSQIGQLIERTPPEVAVQSERMESV